MARFRVEGDEEENQEGPGNDSRLRKKTRISDPVVDSLQRGTASTSNSDDCGPTATSNSGRPASSSSDPQIPLVRESPLEKRAMPVLSEPRTLLRGAWEYASEEEDDEVEVEIDPQIPLVRESPLEKRAMPVLSEPRTLLRGAWEYASEEEDDEVEVEIEDDDDDDEEEEMEDGEEEEEYEHRTHSTPNGNGTQSVERSEDTPVTLSVTLTDPDVLDCPICLEPLDCPVYQCENGHIACASCCTLMKNKCPSCCWPIGYNRCRAIEKVLESIRISCRNKEHGCDASFNYSKKSGHEKTCIYEPCSCPHPNCIYIGLPNNLYSHFLSHSSTLFLYDSAFSIYLDNNQKHAFLQAKYEETVFVLNRFIEPFGSLVSVVCIAPISWKRKLVYEVSASDGVSSIKLKTVAEMTPQWTSGQRPEKKYVIVPNDFLTSSGKLKLVLTIRVEPWVESK